MKIAILTNDYPPESKGGAGRIAATYAKLLEKRGHEIRVWGPSDSFRSLARKSAPCRLIFHLKDLKPQKGIVDEIISWQPDVLISHNLTGCGIATPRRILSAVRGTRHAGLRWIHFLHDVQLYEPSGQIMHGESSKWLRAPWRSLWAGLRRRALGNPDTVVSPTRWLLEQHIARGFFGQSGQEVIPNPISFFCHPLLSSRAQTRDLGVGPGSEAGMTDNAGTTMDSRLHGNDAGDTRMAEGGRDQKQVLFVGRLDADKGVGLLIKAWPILRDSVGRLVFVGEGKMRSAIGKIGDSKIEIRGSLAPHDVAQEMEESGIVVVPSLVMENQPTVILEALSCGCKVVASDVGGIPETLGKAGVIFKAGNVEALAQAIQDALALDFDAALAEDVLKLHDPSVCVDALEGLLKSNL